MNENTTINMSNTVIVSSENENAVQKKIGNTTYIVTSRFNGDKNRDMTSILVHLMEREITNNIPNIMPEIGA